MLAAELLAQLAEVQASRARIVTAADAERRRVERNLHDGAQQHLLLAAAVLARARFRTADPDLAPILDDIAHAIGTAHAELRELARGLHPALLTSDGLDGALESLAERVPLAVTLVALPGQRLPPPVEVAAYYVVAEALTNTAKHDGATGATVRIEQRDGAVDVEVTDDGRGGAVADGPGLQGWPTGSPPWAARLDLCSPPGRGTTLAARLPFE